MTFEERRNALIQADRTYAQDWHSITSTLSPSERKLSSLLKSLVGDLSDKLQECHPDRLHPAQQPITHLISTMRELNHPLWHIITTAPKGACLHVHFDALVDCRWLVKQTYDEGWLMRYVSTNSHSDGSTLADQDGEHPLLDFKYVGVSDHEKYLRGKDGWLHVQTLRRTHSHSAEAFDTFLFNALTLTTTIARGTHNLSDGLVWSRFLRTFLSAHGIIYYKDVFRKYVWNILGEMVGDGVEYVEIRLVMAGANIYDDTGKKFELVETVRHFQQVVQEFRLHATRTGLKFRDAQLIYSSLKAVGTREEIHHELQQCLSLNLAVPGAICGFDLVGYEDAGNPLAHHAQEFEWFQRQKGSVPFVFHAGETIRYGEGERADENLYDALALGTRRIGHGLSIITHPNLLHRISDHQPARQDGATRLDVALEICPISNMILKYAGGGMDMRTHPIWQMVRFGVPVVIAPDDPAIFGIWMSNGRGVGKGDSSGIVSWDLMVLMLAQPGLFDLALLKKMLGDSIKYALVDGNNDEKWLKEWNSEWDAWVQASLITQ